jgi:phosphoribosylformylglycinamidine synthase subunit PurS
MKARIYVTLKPSVLDPQGKAIHHSIEQLGHTTVGDVRQGKYFEVTFTDNSAEDDVKSEAEQIAKNVLANPVIEEYRVEIES